jgi:hypothetical protein
LRFKPQQHALVALGYVLTENRTEAEELHATDYVRWLRPQLLKPPSRGPWKNSLPRILATLEALGKAQREADGEAVRWRA